MRPARAITFSFVVIGCFLLGWPFSDCLLVEAEEWVRSGPEGGEVRALAVHPLNASIVFAGTNDGVYRSDDGGRTWLRSSTGLDTGTPKAIVINPERSNEMFLLLWGRGGLFRSVDGGVTWHLLEFGEGSYIGNLRFSPSPFVLFATFDEILFSSPDGGDTWMENTAIPGEVVDLAVHPVYPEHMAAVLSPRDVARSADGGASWTICGYVTTKASRVLFDPVDSNIMYLQESEVLYRSENGCRTWQTYEEPDLKQLGFLIADPHRRNTLYADNPDGIITTSNGGRNWRRFGPVADPLRGYDMAFSPLDPALIYLAAEAPDDRRGVFRSDFNGLQWEINSTSLCASSTGEIVANPADPSIVYAGAKWHGGYRGHGVFKSRDSGRSWALIEGTEGAGPLVAVDPLAPETVYTTTSEWGILKSTNGGATWIEVWPGWAGRRIGWIEVDHHRRGTLFVGLTSNYNVTYRSDDGGSTWMELSTPDDGYVGRIWSDPRIPGLVFASDENGLSRSTDWGESWVPSNVGLETPPNCQDWGCGKYEWVLEMAFDPVDEDVVYAISPVGSYFSSDGGRTWEVRRDGMVICCHFRVWSDACGAVMKTSGSICEGGPLGFAIDPDRPSTVYASTVFGTYQSYNRGANWKLIVGPESINPETIVAVAGGVLLGSSKWTGVLRLEGTAVPPPRTVGRRVQPSINSKKKVRTRNHLR